MQRKKPNTEPINDQIEAEMLNLGMSQDDVMFAKQMGCRYSRERNSFLFPWQSLDAMSK